MQVWGKQDTDVTSEATSRDRDVRRPNTTCGGSTLSWRWKRCWTAHHGKKAWEYSRRDCVHRTVRVRPGAEKLHAVLAGGLVAPRGKRFKKKPCPRWYTGQFIGSAKWKARLWGNVVGQEASFSGEGSLAERGAEYAHATR